jgi:hypothetical protein
MTDKVLAELRTENSISRVWMSRSEDGASHSFGEGVAFNNLYKLKLGGKSVVELEKFIANYSIIRDSGYRLPLGNDGCNEGGGDY